MIGLVAIFFSVYLALPILIGALVMSFLRLKLPGNVGKMGGVLVSSNGFTADVIVHELAHRIDHQLLSWFPWFQRRIKRLYQDALHQRNGSSLVHPYAGGNVREYFAVGVQSYFTARTGLLNPARDDLKKKDPGLYAFLDEIFGPYAPPIPDRRAPEYLSPKAGPKN